MYYIVGAAIIGAGGAIYSSNKSSKASKEAANTQAEAAGESTDVQWKMYQQSREDIAPWTKAGGEAITKAYDAINDPSKYVQSPYYNFLLDEGIKARTRAASATGNVNSGAFSKDIEKFGQGLATTDFGNYINHLLGVAGMGQTSAGQSANLANVTGQNVGSNILNAGNARASGYINAANASAGGVQGVTNAVNTGINNYLFYDMLRNNNNTLAASAGSGGAS